MLSCNHNGHFLINREILCHFKKIFILIISIICLNNSYGMAQTNQSERISEAEIHIQNEAFGIALTIYKSLWEEYPDNYDYRLRVGLILGWDKQFRRSESHLRSMLNDYPGNIEVGTALMRVLSWQRKFDQTSSVGNALLQLHPNNDQILSILAQASKWNNLQAEAYKLAQEALRNNPDNITALNIVREIENEFAPFLEGYVAFPWDSERTHLSIYSLRAGMALSPSTKLMVNYSKFDAENRNANFSTRSSTLFGTLSNQINAQWHVSAVLGATMYPEINGQDNKNTVSGGLAIRYSKFDYSIGLVGNRYSINESPALILNRINFNTIGIVYRYTDLKWTLIFDPEYISVSDKNERISSNLILNYGIEIDDFVFKPGFKARYLSFKNSSVGSGYFAPDVLRFGLLSADLDWTNSKQSVLISLIGDIGLQQVKFFGVEAEDPKLSYTVGIKLQYQLSDSFELETTYNYSNIASITEISQTDNYWYQVFNIRLRYTFNSKLNPFFQ